ncbi:uncharacterized protein BX663DRAFT_577670 [Cokeromyces recurvatus]|uniref:uncharacterized protein n=1 Tax=Cokeromyces recurvatus TaxID=90255 RepID=UPI00222112A1|nr:uncharacterized protein BX663DRAFT_577670 [Cokeromyces recurvatus]KAI7906538.1 hypothetical protein BX663DRAFT_577670 [Cokeromyces recurvatus]
MYVKNNKDGVLLLKSNQHQVSFIKVPFLKIPEESELDSYDSSGTLLVFFGYFSQIKNLFLNWEKLKETVTSVLNLWKIVKIQISIQSFICDSIKQGIQDGTFTPVKYTDPSSARFFFSTLLSYMILEHFSKFSTKVMWILVYVNEIESFLLMNSLSCFNGYLTTKKKEKKYSSYYIG